MIAIYLAGPPRGKERVKQTFSGGGHSYTPERTVRFEDRLALEAQRVMQGRPLFEGPLDLLVRMFFPVPASWSKKDRAAALAGDIRPTVKPDWDNGGKLTDGLNLVVWIDDKQIVDGRVQKFYSDKPRTEVYVRPATGADAAPFVTEVVQLDEVKSDLGLFT